MESYERLAELIKTQGVVYRPVLLVSGKWSNYYVDLRLITLSPEGSVLAANSILDLAVKFDVAAIGGPSMGADPMAGAITAVSFLQGRQVRGFMVRKEAKVHGIGRQIEGPVVSGMRVAVCDDVVTTGGSLLEAVNALEIAGCRVAVVMAILDREEGARERIEAQGYRFEALYTSRQLGLA